MEEQDRIEQFRKDYADGLVAFTAGLPSPIGREEALRRAGNIPREEIRYYLESGISGRSVADTETR